MICDAGGCRVFVMLNSAAGVETFSQNCDTPVRDEYYSNLGGT